MNTKNLKESAERLQALLIRYAPVNTSAKALSQALTPYLNAALQGSIHEPLDSREIPGRRTFDETDARTLPGLEEAFAQFRIEASGGEPLALRMFRQRHGIEGD